MNDDLSKRFMKSTYFLFFFFFWVWGGGYTDDNLPTYPGDNNIHIPFDYSCVDMNTSILSLAIALSAVWNRYERVT